MERPFSKGCTYIPSPQEIAALTPAERERVIASYDGAIQYADLWIGLLLATLRSLGQLENTVIAVSTDHGMELMERYSYGHGQTPYDEVTRIFLMLFDGGAPIQAGADALRAQGRLFDIGPTLLARAGLPVPATHEGVDLLSARPPELAYSACYNATVVRSNDFKLVEFALDGKWSKERNPPGDRASGDYLYDLRADPHELTNAAALHPDQVARMREGLTAYRTRLGAAAASEPADASDLDETSRARLEALGYLEPE